MATVEALPQDRSNPADTAQPAVIAGGFRNESMRLLIVLGGGGHTTEMLRLVDLLGPEYDYHYVLVKQVAFSVDRIERKGEVYKVRRPRGRYDGLLASTGNSIVALAQIISILIRVRPKAVIGCGPAISVLVSLVGKLMGAKAIYIETGSRVSKLSLSGKLMYQIADLFLVQWPSLQEQYPKAIYAGRL
jgi:UDP-N-acetylglucosamine:LPS N-acetylglucosamine transferase